MSDLWDPFLLYVLETRRGDDREADEEDVGLGVGEGAETVVVFLAWWGLAKRGAAERSGAEPRRAPRTGREERSGAETAQRTGDKGRAAERRDEEGEERRERRGE